LLLWSLVSLVEQSVTVLSMYFRCCGSTSSWIFLELSLSALNQSMKMLKQVQFLG
jgi:hypothetical protein